MPSPVQEEATANAVIQYSVNAPYQISGASPSGNDGNVYSVLPASPLAADPWQLVFCYQADCITLSQPLGSIPVAETNIYLPHNANLTASGNISCSTWDPGSTISWYDATPLHWHISINAVCADHSFAVRGDWQRL